jgi:hypothetical protein
MFCRFIFHLLAPHLQDTRGSHRHFSSSKQNSKHKQSKMEGATDKLQFTGDHYGGVLIDAAALPGDLVVFGQMLEGMPCTRFQSWSWQDCSAVV